MNNIEKSKIYTDLPERELEHMWEEIKGNTNKNSNRNLMKDISIHEIDSNSDIQTHTKEIWDSKTAQYIPFDIWKAYEIVNEKKEKLVMRSYEPASYQPEYGVTLYGWKKYECPYLENYLTEKEDLMERMLPKNKSMNELKNWLSLPEDQLSQEDWRKMHDQEDQEYRYEGRYDEISNKKL